MEGILALFVKLLIIFFGSGLISLIAFIVAKEASTIPRLILMKANATSEKENLKLDKIKNFKEMSAFYELTYNSSKKIKLFSSPTGIKVFK